MTGLGIGGHESSRMGTDSWLTPRHILDPLGEFDLDPCSAPNPLLWPTASRHITWPDDGLLHIWEGRVWLNPPYGRETWVWLDRLAMHGNGTALIFARTETSGFVNTVWNGADAVLFLHGRLQFRRADGTLGVRANGGTANSAGAPSCLVAYGDGDADILGRCGLPGTFVTNWRKPAEAS